MASVFIVEDEAIVAGDIQETVTGLGYTVFGVAKSGEAALEKIALAPPDLVLMDIHLAGRMDGIETAGAIHEKYQIPVIYLTAYADTALLERARVTEPYGYIIKPYDERGLHSAIEMALYKHRMERSLHESMATTLLVINMTQDFLYLIGADGKFLLVNDAFAQYAGMDRNELAGTSAYDLVGRNLLTPRMTCWQLDPRNERHLAFEEQFNHRWYDVDIYPVYSRQGSIEKYAVSIRNSTARKQAEEQAKNNAGYLRALIEEASEVMVMLNNDGTFAQESPSFRSALNVPATESLKPSLFDHISISDYQQAKQALSEILVHPGMAKPVRLKFEKFDGAYVVIKGILSNLSDNPFVGKIVLNGWVE